MAPSKTGSYKQIFKPEKGESLRRRLKAANKQPLGETGPAEKEVNAGMKTRLSGAVARMKSRAVPNESDDGENSDPPLPTSRRSKDQRFCLDVSDSDDDDDDEEDVDDEDDDEDGQKKDQKKAKGKVIFFLIASICGPFVVIIIYSTGKGTAGKENAGAGSRTSSHRKTGGKHNIWSSSKIHRSKIPQIQEAKGGSLKLTRKEIDKFKAAGLWIDKEKLEFGSDWTETKMLRWARGFFDEKIDQVRALRGASAHMNVVSPLIMKGNTIDLIPRKFKWDGRFVAERGRHAGKSASVAAGRLALGMSSATLLPIWIQLFQLSHLHPSPGFPAGTMDC